MAKDIDFVENKDPSQPLSRYDNIRLYVGVGGFVVQETWDPVDIPLRDDDTFHQVLPEEQYRPDLVALRFYNSAHLYWVIGYANNMIDPFAETTPSKRLRIPNRENLFTTVLVQQ